MMSQFKRTVLPLLIVTALLTGCWKQNDLIRIKSDGSTSFEAEVIVTEKGFSEKDIEQLSAAFAKELTTAGWRVEKKWLSRSAPYRLVFVGQGNLREVKSAPSFYKVQRLNDGSYSIRFIPASAQGGKSSRSIKFESGPLGGARVIDEQGREVKAIDQVLGDHSYKIIF